MIPKPNRPLLKLPMIAGVVCCFFLALPCAAQRYMPILPDPGSTSLTRAQQEQIGFKAAKEIYQQMPVLPDSSPETQYVRKIGRRLIAVIPPAHSWPYQFHVVAAKDVNAFALPGGEIFINLGAITVSSNEAELAGVMAHEMAHVYMQHSAKQMQKAQLTQGLAGIAGILLGRAGGVLGSLGQAGIQIGAGMVMLKYSRSDEAQADEVGAMILYRARYNPIAMADFFKKLEGKGGAPPQILSDHPNPGNREEAIQSEIRNWPPEKYRSNNAEFRVVRKEAMKAKAYTAEQIAQRAKSGGWESLNRKNGAVLRPPAGMSVSGGTESTGSGNVANGVKWSAVAPSRYFVLADVGFVKIVRPRNWQVMAPKQQGQSVTIAPSAGVVSRGVGYGVVINAVKPTDHTMSLDQVTRAIMRNFESGQNGLRPVSKIKTIQIAGVRGRSVYMESTSPFPGAGGKPQKETDQLITIPRKDGAVVYLVCVAPSHDFDRLRPTFERMLQSTEF